MNTIVFADKVVVILSDKTNIITCCGKISINTYEYGGLNLLKTYWTSYPDIYLQVDDEEEVSK